MRKKFVSAEKWHQTVGLAFSFSFHSKKAYWKYFNNKISYNIKRDFKLVQIFAEKDRRD